MEISLWSIITNIIGQYIKVPVTGEVLHHNFQHDCPRELGTPKSLRFVVKGGKSLNPRKREIGRAHV